MKDKQQLNHTDNPFNDDYHSSILVRNNFVQGVKGEIFELKANHCEGVKNFKQYTAMTLQCACEKIETIFKTMLQLPRERFFKDKRKLKPRNNIALETNSAKLN